MYAIIETGGKQYKIAKDSVIEVEKISALKDEGKGVTFNNVLLVVNGEDVQIGQPYLKNAKATGELVGNFKSKKTVSFKYRRRKSSKTKKGHRQQLSRVRIKEIML